MRRLRADIDMNGRLSIALRWSVYGALFALVLSAFALMLPPELGGYNDWSDPHSVVHNIAAIAVRVVLFAIIGGAIGGLRMRIFHRNNSRRL